MGVNNTNYEDTRPLRRFFFNLRRFGIRVSWWIALRRIEEFYGQWEYIGKPEPFLKWFGPMSLAEYVAYAIVRRRSR